MTSVHFKNECLFSGFVNMEFSHEHGILTHAFYPVLRLSFLGKICCFSRNFCIFLFYQVSSAQFECGFQIERTKLGKMHCFIRIETVGEQVKTRRNLAHWGSLDTVVYAGLSRECVLRIPKRVVKGD